MFDPASLSGKLLWLRAKDLGANASSVDVWPDQSGTSHDALKGVVAPIVADASTPLGGKSVRFGGTAHLNFLKYRGTPIAAATASSQFNAGYTATNAIDFYPEQENNTSTWATVSGGIPAWLRLQPAAATVVTSYSIIGRITPSVGQSPTSFAFEGSMDGSSWTTLDTQTGLTWSSGEIKNFSFSNATAYTYYRINITAVGSGTIAGLAELTLNPVAGYGIDNPIGASQSAAEIWAVIKADAGGNRGMWSWGEETGAATDSFYHYSNGRVYESFGLTVGNRQDFQPTESTTNWQVYRVRNDGTTWEAWQSGTTQLTASSKPFGYGVVQTIGQTRLAGSSGAFFTGNIAEIFIRDQISTPQEEADLFNYFLNEHLSTGPTVLTETVYTEALATGSTSTQIGAVFAEALASGTVNAQALAVTTEVLVPVQPAQVESVYVETMLNGNTPTQIESVYSEAMLTTTPDAQIESIYAEIMLLPAPSTGFSGWGMAI